MDLPMGAVLVPILGVLDPLLEVLIPVVADPVVEVEQVEVFEFTRD